MSDPTASNTIVPLNSKTQIVNSDGTPTLFFQRWAQERSKDISDAITYQDLLDFLATLEVIAGPGLTGGGALDANVTISMPEISGVAGSYTSLDATIDEFGRVVVAADGSAGAALTVTDGTTSEADVAILTFVGGVVSSTAAGEATVTITGGGGGSSGNPPTLVHADYFRTNSNTTVNTTNAPTPGNFQIILAAGATTCMNGGNLSGFQTFFVLGPNNGGSKPNPGQSYQAGFVFYRVVPPSPGTGITIQTGDWANLAVFEVSGLSEIIAFGDAMQTSGTDFSAPVFENTHDALSFIMVEQDAGNTLTFDILAGVTSLHQYIVSGGDNHTAAVAQFDSSAPSNITGTSSGFTYPLFMNVILKGSSGGGGGGYPAATAPALIGGLCEWFDASNLAQPAGASVTRLTSPDPLRSPGWAVNNNSGVVVGTTLDSKKTATFPGNGGSLMIWETPMQLVQSTIFVVHRPGAMASGSAYTYCCGANQSLQFRLSSYGTNAANFDIVSAAHADVGSSTGSVTTGTAFQGNMTYDSSGGNYAFRIGQAASGSGNNPQPITANTTLLGVNGSSGGENLNGDLAELIVYSRVLTLTEIQAVEAYLFAKWGV